MIPTRALSFCSNWRASQLVKEPLIENPKKPHMIPTTRLLAALNI